MANTPFCTPNRHLFISLWHIAIDFVTLIHLFSLRIDISSAQVGILHWCRQLGYQLRQRSPHIDITMCTFKARGIENRHSASRWHWSQNLGYWMSMPKLNAPAEIHWRRSNMNKRDPILMISVEVPKDCRSLNADDEMNCPHAAFSWEGAGSQWEKVY